ncbi:MAG: hypothetical protein IIU73_07230 [Selenomonadales bacterium]|nr:hypothetical protein [Selenomonadales bacterium]
MISFVFKAETSIAARNQIRTVNIQLAVMLIERNLKFMDNTSFSTFTSGTNRTSMPTSSFSV